MLFRSENLQDHFVLGNRYRLKKGAPSVNSQSRGLSLVGEVFKWLFTRKGMLTLSAAHIAAFVKTRPELGSEEHTSELQSLTNLVCRLLLEKKKKNNNNNNNNNKNNNSYNK